MLLSLAAGDRLSITDVEGDQSCLMWAPSLAALDLAASGITTQAELLKMFGEAAREALAGLATSGIEADAPLACAEVISSTGAAGRSWRGVLKAPMLLVISAPGTPMTPDTQDAPTPLWIEIDHAGGNAGLAPPPLAPPLQDIRVTAATAQAYRVKAGEYIQIIDVDGRQCSDFVAFDAAALAAGIEHGIDATATRTILGSAFAAPGLHAKYFDDRLRPLVEVVRDTVGRHDTFLLACAAKYYDDAGFPGHANCTENFNNALTEHGIAPRAGWPATAAQRRSRAARTQTRARPLGKAGWPVKGALGLSLEGARPR